jgi:omega-6 fatty acid desaturase (delta-12 desaturase)
MTTASPAKEKPVWTKIVAAYNHPENRLSRIQIANSFLPYFALMVLAYATVHTSWLIAAPLSILAGMFMVRIFIIQHDCGHQSFFKSKRANNWLGFICGVMTFTPYAFWRATHAIHHATSGDLDYRGIGDIETKTLAEYEALGPLQRLGYRLYRNPFLMFTLGPLYVFLILQRTPLSWKMAKTMQAKRSLLATDFALLVLWGAMVAHFGLATVLMVQLPSWIVTGSLGVWLFYVQHNFEDAYWRLHPEWTYEEAAIRGSSYYQLPKIMQWFSGNIGLHHIHHLSPKIPNYLLQKAYDENEYFRKDIQVLTLKSSLEILVSRLALWDAEEKRMITFGYAHKKMAKAAQTPAAAPVGTAPVVGSPAADMASR